MKEYTYIMIKPDGVRKGLTEEIVKRIQDKGFKIELFDVRKLNADILAEHYAHLVDKPFYPELRDFMLSDYVVPMLVSGENAVLGMRDLMGPTKSALADAGLSVSEIVLMHLLELLEEILVIKNMLLKM